MATLNIGKSASLLVLLILPIAAWAQSLETRCRAYGFEPNTPHFGQCLMQLDQAERQAAVAKKARQDLESRCELVKAQAYFAPTRTGSFFESLQIAESAYESCMAGLPPSRPVNLICQRHGLDQVRCFSQ